MTKRFYVHIVLLFFILPLTMAQDLKFKAIFMYNFTKYMEWPDSRKTGDFIIGIYGNSPIIDELNIIAEMKKVGNQSIVIQKINNLSEAGLCHMFYIPETKTFDIEEVRKSIGTKGTVLITDKAGMAQKVSGINYVKVNGKQNFEINRSSIEKQGIKVNSALMSLGISVQ